MPDNNGEFLIEILDDGRIKVTTSKFSPAIHMTAEKLLRFLEGAIGKDTVAAKGKHSHTHDHVHEEGKLEA